MKSNVNEFCDTYNFFMETFTNIGVVFPISFEVWKDLPSDLQSSALFINFFPQIYNVWKKLKNEACVDSDSVSEVLMYLQKNVSKILEDPRRFTSAYIYRVSYNCMYYTIMSPYTATSGVNGYYRNTIHGTFIDHSTGEELDLFDATSISMDEELTDPEKSVDYNDFWKLIDSLDEQSKKVLYGFMEGRQRIKGVPGKERKKIVKELQKIFEPYKDLMD